MLNKKTTVALAATLIHAPLLHAQSVNWSVIAGEDSRIVASSLPAASRTITDYLYGDTGNGQLSFYVASPTASIGYWAMRGGSLTHYGALGNAGLQGPGRSGSESGHVFLNFYTQGGAGAGGQRSFVARAGDAGSAATATYGVWRWDTNRNVEIARSFVEGPLGPGLPGWIFKNESGFATPRTMDNGKVVMDVNVQNATTAGSSRMIVKHVPGQGNLPCVRAGATEAALAPGLAPGDSFQTPWSLSDISVTPAGRVYASLSASGSRGGIWELCNGAPRALVANNDTGPLGPDFGVETAIFTTDLNSPYPVGANEFYFFGNFRDTPSSTSRTGLFWHNGSANKALAMNEASGFHGPNWNGTTWKTFYTNSLSVGGRYATFMAGVDTPDNADPEGFWRVRAGGRPELVALIGVPGGLYGPEAGRSWRSFSASAVLPNGDLLLEAATDPGNIVDLWLLEPGKSPRRVLSVGQPVTLPTTNGPVQGTVSSFDLPLGGAAYSRGPDSWVGADGSLTFNATVSGYGEVVLSARPSDRIYRDSFD